MLELSASRRRGLPEIGLRGPDVRPDPGQGVFTTLLVRNGIALDATEHITRVLSSSRELFGEEPRVDLEERVAEVARRWEQARLRIVAAPGPSGRLNFTVVAEPLSLLPNPPPCVLAPVTLAGGLGPHKWCDRRMLSDLERVTGAVPLLVDVDGHVLEAAHANVFAAQGTMLVTPPLDGRLLPGVVRARLLEVGAAEGLAVREEPVPLGRLAAADELLLTSSLRGIHPAQLIGGGPGRFALGARLRAALR